MATLDCGLYTNELPPLPKPRPPQNPSQQLQAFPTPEMASLIPKMLQDSNRAFACCILLLFLFPFPLFVNQFLPCESRSKNSLPISIQADVRNSTLPQRQNWHQRGFGKVCGRPLEGTGPVAVETGHPTVRLRPPASSSASIPEICSLHV